ncbi:MAG: TraB/GumN family protein [Exilispira sp.]|jgi:pheromone shutdown-related protein TraB|nr:TraB/GumN family protein [Exilispira sp.]
MNNDNIKVIEIKDKKIILVGTAHVIKESVEKVRQAIDEYKPDKIAVELCNSRYSSLQDKNRWEKLDIIKVIKEGKGFLLLATMILSSFQKRIGLDLGSAPGAEMIEAVDIAKEKNIDLILADRDVNVTLKRAWTLSKFKDKIRILEVLIESIFTKEKLSEEDIQNILKDGDLLSTMMNEFAKELPEVKKVFIDERDEYIANKILSSEGKIILAVVGRGHLEGIANKIESGFEYDYSIEQVPIKKNNSNLIGWIITLIIIGLFASGFFIKGPKVVLSMLKYWVLISGASCFISSILVLSHPLTILASWIVAPITTLNPTVGAGMFLAIIEATFRKPRVSDFENLTEDIQRFKGYFNNRILHALVVFLGTSIGASIGTFIGIPWITSLLK